MAARKEKNEGERDARHTAVVIDFTRLAEEEFDASRPLLVATIREGQVIDKKEVVPAREKNPRRFEVKLNLGPSVDGVAGAQVVVAPADDERNLFSQRVAKTYVAGREPLVDAGTIYVQPGIYKWWRFCWFPRTYRVTGRVVRHDGDCVHPIGAAVVELHDVDYCWYWYDEDLVASGTTDADGYFDITFTWCRPLWCFLKPIEPPILIDPHLRDRLRKILKRLPIPLPDPLPDPPDPWRFERILADAGVILPRPPRPEEAAAQLPRMRMAPRAASTVAAGEPDPARALANVQAAQVVDLTLAEPPKVHWHELLGDLIAWPICDDPCDWRPDLRIRVFQNQPDGQVEIYRDSFFQIHWNLDDDLLDLELEANEEAMHGDTCADEPLLGNCMLLERVGDFAMPAIYQPDAIAGVASYGTTPGSAARLGYTTGKDRAWCLTLGVHGDFGMAAQVDYYQVQVAKWNAGDLAAFAADPSYRPPDIRFTTMTASSGLAGFTRSYAELVSVLGFHFHVWKSEPFSPQTIGTRTGLYKSRQRFQQEYVASHGAVPAPDFAGGWYWNTTTMTRLFNLDSEMLSDGLYSFRFIGYTQTGVDAGGQPILEPVNMGLPDGVMRRCGGADAPILPELLTLYLDNQRRPDCEIVRFRKNGVDDIDECEMLVLDNTDFVDIEYQVEDSHGNLEGYAVYLRRGSGANLNIRTHPIIAPSITITGTDPAGPDYLDALADPMAPATPPDWNGGTWTARVPASAFVAMGGSCAYNLALRSWNRHTNGWSYGQNWHEVRCEDDRAFTIILSADKETFCEQLGC